MVDQILADYTQFSFNASDQFMWSPMTATIHFDRNNLDHVSGVWSLMHELGHALLSHQGYEHDIDLIKLERAAWDKAVELSQHYQIEINEDHVENCMDSYRDWLKSRSTCPDCDNVSLQTETATYRCFNCGCSWQVSASPICQVQRRKV